ncbi:sigma-70 family RNA polymerase sigma factor [Candidatus Poribacteria bacterium]|nr:sigma-70 family RNA polymerase sigma factor [Candidatus Poribacteria bacterium]
MNIDKFREYYQTKNPALREQLINENRGLVHSVANKFRYVVDWGIMELNDLEQAGYEGLVQSVDRFDPNRGYTFGTFAVHRIRGAIQNEIARYRGRVPRELEVKVQKVKQAVEKLKKEMGYEPTEQELADLLQMSVDEIIEAWQLCLMLFPQSLDDDIGAIPEEEDALKAELSGAIDQLPPDQQRIVKLYLKGYTFDKIAKKLGKPPGTVKTIFYQQIIPALKKLMQ